MSISKKLLTEKNNKRIVNLCVCEICDQIVNNPMKCECDSLVCTICMPEACKNCKK